MALNENRTFFNCRSLSASHSWPQYHRPCKKYKCINVRFCFLTHIRRNRSAKHYRHRASPDTNTVASLDSSGSESRGGLNRYYRQAWENLHQSAASPKHSRPHHHHHHHHAGGRRKDIAADGSPRVESMRDGSELVVNDVYHPRSTAGPMDHNKKSSRHHHHHHHHQGRSANRY